MDINNSPSLDMKDYMWMPSLEISLNIRKDEIEFWP